LFSLAVDSIVDMKYRARHEGSGHPGGGGRLMRLRGKVAVITGGAAGIGFAYARRFLAEGASVVVGDVADPVAAAEKLGAPDRTLGVWADVSDAASASAMVAAAVARFGRIDVLVNNAAVFAGLRPRPFDEIPGAEWDRVMAVNVTGVWNSVRAAVPVMRAQGGGRIVNVASAIVAKGTALLLHYVTSKGAVVAMTRALARELGPSGITVNAVAPGLILSDTLQANPDMTGFQREAVMQARSIKRDAFPEDVEGAVVFLASDDSAFMSGQTLVVDGGSVFSTL
jgi:NAD(P)-dependent dehydrogenase (short-subunit alcohol dehydrogenase family)